jgi:bifunctional non-homologous end joining protein LigD
MGFEGHIPEGNYGAGDVAIWDTGLYDVRGNDDAERQLAKGHLKVEFHGKKLRGAFALVRMDRSEKEEWLLIKDHDEWAKEGWQLQTVLSNGKRGGEEGTVKTTGAKLSKMPTNVKPMLATLVDEPFSDEDWLFEVKWDGYRALCFVENGKARLISRNGQDLGSRFSKLPSVPGWLDARSALIDGELVALDDEGISRFQLLQPKWRGRGVSVATEESRRIVYYAFDLLFYNGQSLLNSPLIERKELLKRILQSSLSFRYSDHVLGHGEELYKHAKSKGLEGIIAKRQESKYEQRRSREWLKIKITRSVDVVIGGFTAPRGARKHIGALLVGLYRGNDLVSVGHVGAGSTVEQTREIYERLKPLEIEKCPFREKPRTNEPARWVKPEIVCEVKYSEWTADRQLRQPILLGIREDKSPKACAFEEEKAVETIIAEDKASQPKALAKSTRQRSLDSALGSESQADNATMKIDGHEVSLSNLNKKLWSAEGYTKRDLLRYYALIAPFLLPHLKDRPLILQRYPHGVGKPAFFQHNVEDAPGYVRIFEVEESSGTVCYAVCNNEAALLYLVNLAAIAFNPWHSRIDNVDWPDWVVFDLDPHDAPFEAVLEVALATRTVLSESGLECYPKTSGASGMHVYVPIARRYDYTQSLQFANAIGALVENQVPKLITRERMVRERPEGRIYFDCYQNSKGKTIASPYSVRARAGATVSMPITWQQVERGIKIEDFAIQNVPDLVKHDLFEDVLQNHQTLPKAFLDPRKGRST